MYYFYLEKNVCVRMCKNGIKEIGRYCIKTLMLIILIKSWETLDTFLHRAFKLEMRYYITGWNSDFPRTFVCR